jgi:hypothetical protein
MLETTATTVDQGTVDQTSADQTTVDSNTMNQNASGEADSSVNFTERYTELLGKVNQALDQVDWQQMGRIGKAIGVLLVVIVAQILIKGVLDTINLLPVVPGLLELTGLVVVGQWSWKNLTTGEKRSAVVTRLQQLRQEYLG